jgi:hypothetical protein
MLRPSEDSALINDRRDHQPSHGTQQRLHCAGAAVRSPLFLAQFQREIGLEKPPCAPPNQQGNAGFGDAGQHRGCPIGQERMRVERPGLGEHQGRRDHQHPAEGIPKEPLIYSPFLSSL